MKTLNDLVGEELKPDLTTWDDLVKRQTAKPRKNIRVGMVAKYLDNEDTYISVIEALKSASWGAGVGLDLVWIDAEQATKEDFAAVDALVVPGGFGSRGIEGKIAAATYALEHNKPYLGLCLGLQVAMIAAARKAGLKDANSTEFVPDAKHDVVYIMAGQEGKESTGGTLASRRLSRETTPGTLTAKLYDSKNIVERHRHRYEVNQNYLDEFKQGGLEVSGTSPDGKLVEFIEAPKCDFFVATQAHPEFRSRPMRPHPLFAGLITAASK